MAKNKIVKKNIKVCIAMSGGIDSSVAAALLKKQGYNCIGIFMRFWKEADSKIQNKCCSADAYNDARIVANRLGFNLYAFNFKDQFKKEVVDKWLIEHKKGNTPNPCINCNKFIKFGYLLSKAKKLGCNYLATGHYVKKIEKKENNKIIYGLACGNDKNKDQSYFLYNLKQQELKHLIFPLGNYLKSETIRLAKKFNLPVYQKPESQEICFIPEKTHYPFLKRHLKLKPGQIKNSAGKVIGRHPGLPLYTLGQREGIGIGGIGPFYVVGLNYKTNTLFVSNKHNDKLLYSNKFKIKNINWIRGQAPKNSEIIGVRIRYQAKTIPAKIKKNIVILKYPVRAVMPGQSAVFYKGRKLIGGGVIQN